MRKLLVITLVGALLFAAIPGVAVAGGHSGSDLAAGLVLGATAAVVGGVLLNVFAPPVVYAPAPPVVYRPAPPVVYAPAPVVVHRNWAPRYHWKQERYRQGHGWNRH